MNKKTRLLVALSAALMIGGFFFPFWRIVLDAPQYPEGLEMKIWLNRLSGDVEKVNGLNHYIGMKHIHEDEFREFTILPVAMGILIALGFAAALFKSRKLLWTYVVLLLIGGIVAFYDFYSWEYDYGHNLNPHAAIKVPGMAYQPPLLGYKVLLNFIAGSFPDTGGILVITGALLALFLLVKEQWFTSAKSLQV